MSRRIALFLLAATAALNVQPAAADRECFANLCQLSDLFAQPSAPKAQTGEVRPRAQQRNAATARGAAPVTLTAQANTAPPAPAGDVAAPQAGTATPERMMPVVPWERPVSAEGFWPDSVYVGVRGAPIYAIAPNARIIRVEPNN